VAAGYAVLAYLDRGRDVVVVATHDLELLDLLGGTYVAHHFREHVDGDGLRFDYRIQPGPSSTRNAIALLRYMKYPDGVVADALAAIDWQHPAR
jgi:DNA mismatch repair ATPase MutS